MFTHKHTNSHTQPIEALLWPRDPEFGLCSSTLYYVVFLHSITHHRSFKDNQFVESALCSYDTVEKITSQTNSIRVDGYTYGRIETTHITHMMSDCVGSFCGICCVDSDFDSDRPAQANHYLRLFMFFYRSVFDRSIYSYMYNARVSVPKWVSV